MKEKIIDFITAKLAKEKGFDWDMGWNEFYYDTLNGNKLIHGSSKHYPNELNHENYGEKTENQIKYDKWELQLIKAPTQSLLQKWLRDVCEISVTIYNLGDLYDYDMCSVGDRGVLDFETVAIDSVYFDTYEDALEKGLQGALNLIEI